MSIAPAERVETSLEELAGLDFEPEMKCEWAHGECPKAAKWWSIQPCCKARYTACDPHVQGWLQEVAEAPNLLFECITCNSVITAMSIIFEPIKVSS
jgi:hypothetical protein